MAQEHDGESDYQAEMIEDSQAHYAAIDVDGAAADANDSFLLSSVTADPSYALGRSEYFRNAMEA